MSQWGTACMCTAQADRDDGQRLLLLAVQIQNIQQNVRRGTACFAYVTQVQAMTATD
jgi:hypothetical protein